MTLITVTGGVAALYHRLMAFKPPACSVGSPTSKAGEDFNRSGTNKSLIDFREQREHWWLMLLSLAGLQQPRPLFVRSSVTRSVSVG